ncbi:reverse transcriptase/maturase family protein [Brasilonema bromeliae]|uniref:Maturase n=1 Tax=Brasilonema bromeliae SPC951 TaxID=385972 RepID=A0ABX1PEM9_9CYAN|nr:reverse transcriptase/maturase family protein [Brasilonema bromeliae]NMG22331.1 maturase [Brasilonema bromeliae SPC951]
MRNAETVLGIIHERGQRGLPLEDVYRQLFNPDLFLKAYGKIYRNTGAMTPGATGETVDGMSRAKIDTIISDLRYERYQWMPARRVYIEKKNSLKKRPLGIPRWSDKLLQEVIRLILEAYYEPQFNPTSHGFRPGRGCHTALSEIYSKWVGTKWFVEGDIAQCFDSLNHTVLLTILREKIHDNRFLRLIENLLKAGYLEEWRYNATLSGSPQGAILSPILANIYLDKLDKFVENELIPKYNRGKARQPNPEWQRLQGLAQRLRKKGLFSEAHIARKLMQQVPSLDPQDPNYRRLRYVRYADDWLIGFSGPRQEAEEIKRLIGNFLRENLKLELSETKTLISHPRTEAARFLGYDIVVLNNNQKLDRRGHRSINGQIGLKVPPDVVKSKCARFLLHGKPIHRAELIHDSVFSIVAHYQQEFQGIVEYYRLAYNLHQLNRLKWVMERSLTQTLAHKLRTSVSTIYRRYQTTLQTRNGPYIGLQVTVERGEGQKPLIANWGGISLKRNMKAVLNDSPLQTVGPRTELECRLLANTCELCGSQENVQVHHVRALKDLQKEGRNSPPYWVQIMAARQRKTLIVCQQCHMDIHAGRATQRTNTDM